MIKSFKCRETEHLWNGVESRKLPFNVQARALEKLRMLNRSSTLNDLRSPPGNRLKNLSGRRAGQTSIRINDQWRICFKWKNNEAHEVEIVDYHRG